MAIDKDAMHQEWPGMKMKMKKKMREKYLNPTPSFAAPEGHPRLGPMGQKLSDEIKKKGLLDGLGGQRERKAAVKNKRGGGKVGDSVKTYSSGGYVEGE